MRYSANFGSLLQGRVQRDSEKPEKAIAFGPFGGRRFGWTLVAVGAVIRVYDAAGNVIETHEHAGEFKGDFVTRLGKRHARA